MTSLWAWLLVWVPVGVVVSGLLGLVVGRSLRRSRRAQFGPLMPSDVTVTDIEGGKLYSTTRALTPEDVVRLRALAADDAKQAQR